MAIRGTNKFWNSFVLKSPAFSFSLFFEPSAFATNKISNHYNPSNKKFHNPFRRKSYPKNQINIDTKLLIATESIEAKKKCLRHILHPYYTSISKTLAYDDI